MKDGPVLLLDDEPVVLQVHAAAVRQFGFEAVLAETAEEALEIARSRQPSLVISDVQMPGEGGFDFIEGLNKQGLKTMPAIYLTGYNDIDIVRGGLRAGGDDFIIKGSSVEVLRRRIAFWMASGFNELPSELRRRALIMANAVKGDTFTGIKEHFETETGLLQRAQTRIALEILNVPSGYGTRLVERVCLLGRLSNILITESSSFGDLIRFPDHMDQIIRQMDVPWAKDMWPLFSRFEDWSCDTRFVLSGVEPLKAFSEYDWFIEGLGE
tara:strand:+ start:267 stop:1073 length:807 start_codon:yes stop_codon:yes gene_type:complete